MRAAHNLGPPASSLCPFLRAHVEGETPCSQGILSHSGKPNRVWVTPDVLVNDGLRVSRGVWTTVKVAGECAAL